MAYSAAVLDYLRSGVPKSAGAQGHLAKLLNPGWVNTNPGGDPYGSLNPAWVEAGQLLENRAMFTAGPTEPSPVPAMGTIAEKASYGIQTVQDFIVDHPVAAGATVLGLGGAVGGTIYTVKKLRSKKKRSSSTRGRKGSSRRSSGRRLKFGSPAWRKRYMKGGRRSGGGKRRNRRGGAVKDRYKGRKVYRTKRGQPYILMANGKARFVRA